MPLMSGQYQMTAAPTNAAAAGHILMGLMAGIQNAQRRSAEQQAQSTLMRILGGGGTAQEALAAMNAPAAQPQGFGARLLAGLNPNTPAPGPTETGQMLTGLMMREAVAEPYRRAKMEQDAAAQQAAAQARAQQEELSALNATRNVILREMGFARQGTPRHQQLLTVLSNVERRLQELAPGGYGTGLSLAPEPPPSVAPAAPRPSPVPAAAPPAAPAPAATQPAKPNYPTPAVSLSMYDEARSMAGDAWRAYADQIARQSGFAGFPADWQPPQADPWDQGSPTAAAAGPRAAPKPQTAATQSTTGKRRLTRAQAMQIFERAGRDVQKAEQMAREMGYDIDELAD
jgi:hypothetical protein